MNIRNAHFIFALMLPILIGCNRSTSKLSGGSVQTCTGTNCSNNSTLFCQMIINNAYAIPFNGSSPASATVQVRANQSAAVLYSLELRPTGASNSTNIAPAGMALNASLNVSIPGPTLEGQILATVRTGTGQANCAASYKLTQNAPQPTGQLLYVNLGYNILGWDQTSGYWYRRNASNVAEAFAKWPTGVIYDNVVAGDFNGDQKADVLGRNPATGEFYVALADVVTATAVLAFTTNASSPPTGLRIADLNSDGRSDVAFIDASGSEVSYQPEMVYNGIYFRGPIAAPPTLTLTVTPSGIIPAGLSATIQWTSNVNGCTLYGPTGTVVIGPAGPVTGKSGTYTTPPLAVSQVAVMQCVNGQGGNPLVRQIPLQVGPPLNSTLALNSDKDFVAVNGTVLISIALSNVQNCILDRDGTVIPVPTSLQVSQTLASLPAKFTVNCKKYTGENISATKTIYAPIVVTANPTSLNFASVPINTESAIQIVTYTNPNPTLNVQVSNVAISNNRFQLREIKCGSAIVTAGNPFTIPPGGNCQLKILVAVPAAETYNGTLGLTYGNGVGTPTVNVALTATGLAPKTGK